MIHLEVFLVILMIVKDKVLLENSNGKFHRRISSKDKFGFIKHQENATNGLGFKINNEMK